MIQELQKQMTNDFIDQYLTVEDQELIRRKEGDSRVRAFPGSEMFHLIAEAKRVKLFVETGNYGVVIGFGVDFLINRGFHESWYDLSETHEIVERVESLLNELVDDGHTFDENQLDKLYAWIHLSPYEIMSMSESIRRQLHRVVDLFWTSCVTKNGSFGTHCNDAAHVAMIDIVRHWSERIVIPHKGVGAKKLLV